MTDDLSALPKPVREALQRLCAPFDPFIQDSPLSNRDGSLAAARIVAAELLRMADECATLKTQSIYPRAQLLGNLTAANERAERAEAELAEARETIKRLLGQNKVQYDFLSSRQCPDHAGKWERGKCLQCALEKAEAELASAARMHQQLPDTLGANDQADAMRIIAHHHARELAQSEPPK